MNATMAYVRQLLAGRDFAVVNPAAGQMMNFVYLVGDRDTKECVLVDPAWDVRGVLAVAAEEGLTVVGVVATHDHQDHVGGNLFGLAIEGAAKVVELAQVKVWVHELDAVRLARSAGVADADLVRVTDGSRLTVGQTEIELIHTPGHTPGSMCLRVGDGLITGDTLFVGACGRVDLPGSNPDDMYASLQKLAALPDDLVVYPGHHYGSARTSTIGEQKRTNPYLRVGSLAEWRALQGE
jgi:glyoxylase-like metal-dependent hydrolase (beta-lactamase superfamily II)